MLETLSIHHFAIIDHCEISFKNGFSVLTGETGAGKSILIDAISLLLGKPAKETYIQTGHDTALIQGRIQVPLPLQKGAVTTYLDRDGSTDLIVVRKLSRRGQNQITLNGQMVNLKTLRDVMSPLISILGQHEFTHLLDPQHHMALLDLFSGPNLKTARHQYKTLYRRYQTLENTLHQGPQSLSEVEQKIDFLTFQYNELKDAHLVPEEEASLLSQKQQAKHHQKIGDGYLALQRHLKQIEESTHLADREVTHLLDLQPQLTDLRGFLDGILTDISTFSRDTESYGHEHRQQQPLDINMLEQRLDTLFKLKAKFRVATTDDLLARQSDIETELSALKTRLMDRESIEKERLALHTELATLAKTLHQYREASAKDLTTSIETHLKDLNLNHTTFHIDLDFQEDYFGPEGSDRIQFMISTNPGEPLKPLLKVASGGELSRLMLAIQSVFYAHNPTPILVFDEIDVGIGGLTALQVGQKLQRLSESSQVLCITHLAQVAKFANHHFKITKTGTESGVRTEVAALSNTDQKEELSRMMGGSEMARILTAS